MRNSQLFLFFKKVHRYLVMLIIMTGLVMIITGIMLYLGQFLIFDSYTVGWIHNNISIFFAVILLIMMITGFYLFIFPYLPVKKSGP